MKNIERRAFAFELRAAKELPEIAGHAALFNSISETLGSFMPFREIIRPGAFAKTIKQDDIRMLWNHNTDMVLGRNRAGTLRLAEDDKGLVVENDPPDAAWARDLITSMQRGDVTQMSFGFSTITAHWETKDGMDLRVLEEVRLFDVSPVTFPAYTKTDVSVRSADAVYADFLSERDGYSPLYDLRLRELNLRLRRHP